VRRKPALADMPPRSAIRSRVASGRKSSTGKRNRSGQGNTRPTRFATGEFVALDGEGFSEGEAYVTRVGKSGNVYEGRRHNYAYLSASDGSEIYNPHGRLRIDQILRYLFERSSANPRAIFVVFGGGYDFAHWVIHDLNKSQLQMLMGKHPTRRWLDIQISGMDYRLECQMRKCMTIQRWEGGSRKYFTDARGKRRLTKHDTIRVWDVWGFFQASFAEVMRKWLPGDPDYEFILRMKGERSIFDRAEIETIKTYNAAELRILVKVMDKVRDAIGDLGLKITRWDGAGAIAAAMMQKHNVKEHMQQPPPEVFDAARMAYSGGHIEVCKMGYHNGKVHHYDVNSAYPAEYRYLPSLRVGEWKKGYGVPDEGFTIVHLRYSFVEGREFYPLFFRCGDGSIIYPSDGAGWYWWPEYQTAKMYDDHFSFSVGSRIDGTRFDVIEYYTFHSDVVERPFAWVEDYYSARQQRIAEAKAKGIEDGPEKVYKLGYNSLYGKNAQQVGAKIDPEGVVSLPSYFQLEWAGYVTAGCRAKLMEAAIQSPSSIIGFATDGLFSTAPLRLHSPKEKLLGAWDYQIHDGITMVMPGVYWLHDGDEVKNYSRGFDKKEMSDAQFIHDAWRRKEESLPISVTRLIGIGTGTASVDFWNMRGDFVTSKRTLTLDGDNSKRYPVMLYKHRPERGLIATIPRARDEGNLLDDISESAPYPIAWIDRPDPDLVDPENEQFEMLEVRDAELA
jgi:DNA polymerase type B, organellar and viral